MSDALSLPSQLHDQRILTRELAHTQLCDHSLSASLSESVICLISTFQQVEECLLSRANCISQPVDLRLLSPAISAYSAIRSVPDSHLINDYQPLDHRLISFTISTYSATWSEPVRQLNSTCQPLDHRLITCTISAYSAA